MKYTSLFLFLTLLLFSCGDSDSSTNNGANNGGNNGANNGANNGSALADFDCSTFFESGDYSSACFPEGMLPAFTQTNVGESVCHYKIGKQEGGDDMVSVSISSHAESIVNNIFTGIRADESDTLTEVEGVGEEAFLNESGRIKVLHVRYKTVLLSFTVQDNTPSPCTYDSAELESFAKLVVGNLSN